MPILGSRGAASAKGFGLTSGGKLQFVAISHATSPYISVYPWAASSGFGTKITNPGTLPPSNANGVAFSPAKNAIAVVSGVSPYVTAYPWTSAGFGTKFTDPSSGVGAYAYSVAFAPDASAICIGSDNSAGGNFTYIKTYAWSVSGFGSKYANPPSGGNTFSGRGVTFNSTGTVIAVAMPFSASSIIAFPWSAGYGSSYAAPAVPPTGTANTVAFNPAGTVLACGGASEINFYAWSSGFGSKYANPATSPAGASYGVSFSPKGDAVAVTHNNSPYVTAYPWSSGYGTKYSDPSTLPAGNGSGIAFLEM